MYKKAAEPTEYGTGGTVTGWGFNRNAKTLLLSPTNNFKIKKGYNNNKRKLHGFKTVREKHLKN